MEEKKADMLAPNAEFSTSVVNRKIYAIGGLTPWATGFSRVEEYDSATDTWRERADMPTPRWGLSTSVVNGKIYAIGGTDVWIGTTTQGLQTVEEYDPVTDTWRKRADMPTARFWFTTSAVNGKIYAIGGKQSKAPADPSLSIVEEYDPGFVLEDKAKSVGAKGKLATTWGKVK